MVEEEGAGDNRVRILDISGSLVPPLLPAAAAEAAAALMEGTGGGGGALELDPDPGGVGILECLELDPIENGPGEVEDGGRLGWLFGGGRRTEALDRLGWRGR